MRVAAIRRYTYVCTVSGKLRSANVRRVTFVQSGAQNRSGDGATGVADTRTVCPSKLFTFRNTLDYGEDQLLRHIEPPMAHHLSLIHI